MVVSKRRKKRKVKPLLDGIWIRVLLTAFLDEKECRCFITGPETGLVSGVSNRVGGMASVTSGAEHTERGGKEVEENEFRIFVAR